MLIGISGKAKSGKDKTLSFIQNKTNHLFENKKFATPVKEIASTLLDLPVELFESQDVKDAKISSFFKTKNEDWTKIIPWPNEIGIRTKLVDLTVRDMLIGIGDGLRKTIHEDIWVNKLFRNNFSPKKNWCITDVRYPNEANKIIELGGFLIRINRKDIPLINSDSEKSLDNYHHFKYVIDNNETLDKLEKNVIKILLNESII